MRQCKPIKIAFLIRALDIGGAERQLVALAKGLDRDRFAPSVVTFYPGGPLEPDLREADVPILCLEKRGPWESLALLRRLKAMLAELQPEILHAYMPAQNMVAALARPAGTKLVWGIRQSPMSAFRQGFGLGLRTQLSYLLEKRLIRRPDLIISNAQAGAAMMRDRGAPAARVLVIPNGIDCERFQPRPEGGRKFRRSLGIAPDHQVIGVLARLDPMKGHEVLLQAMARLTKQRRGLALVCVGGGLPSQAEALRARAHELGLDGRVYWAGSRNDIPELLSAFDLHSSASLYGEGFSNAIGESMAAGVPQVVTDVGDSAAIVGGTGRVVPKGDPDALATAWEALLDLTPDARQALGSDSRRRIVEHFSLDAMVERSQQAYDGLLTPSEEEIRDQD